jgi:hypothetical protein
VGEIYPNVIISLCAEFSEDFCMRGGRTVYAAIKILAADFAKEMAYCGLLVHFHGYRVFVVAEEALESGWEGFFL